MVNIDNARFTFKAMSESNLKIDMWNWFTGVLYGELVNECGTAACFAGHTISALMPEARYYNGCVGTSLEDSRMTPMVAQELLGLTEGQADRLFSASICLAHKDQKGCEFLDCDLTSYPSVDQLKSVFAAVTQIDRSELD